MTRKNSSQEIFVTPGDYILDYLERREWTQEDLAAIMDVSPKSVNQIIKGKQSITPEMAQLLGEAFNKTPEYWLNLEMEHQLQVKGLEEERLANVGKRVRLYQQFPIQELLKKGWIKASSTIQNLESNLVNILGFKQIEDFDKATRQVALYRKSNEEKEQHPNLQVWLQITQHLASQVDTPPYQKQKLSDLYKELHKYTYKEDGVKLFLEKLTDIGVIFMYLPHLQKTYVDGVAHKNKEEKPYIVYTGRYKRIDNFWFTLGHEIGHILQHLDKNSGANVYNSQEGEADAMALEVLKKNEIMENLEGHLNYLADAKILEVANKIKVHPAIISGILSHEGYINYARIHRFNEDSVSKIPDKYWGINILKELKTEAK